MTLKSIVAWAAGVPKEFIGFIQTYVIPLLQSPLGRFVLSAVPVALSTAMTVAKDATLSNDDKRMAVVKAVEAFIVNNATGDMAQYVGFIANFATEFGAILTLIKK